jgi:hypothetical protein
MSHPSAIFVAGGPSPRALPATDRGHLGLEDLLFTRHGRSLSQVTDMESSTALGAADVPERAHATIKSSIEAS